MIKNTERAISMLQVPNEIIRHKDLSASDFVLYAYLKYKCFQSEDSNTLNLNHTHTMAVLHVSDLRTFKKMLQKLYSLGIIMSEPKIPKRGYLIVDHNITDCIDKFTQLPVNILNHIDRIGHIGFRLLYLYESYINRKIESKSFCYAGYKEITTTIGISEPSLSKYNDILVSSGLLKITKHKLSTDTSFNGGKLIVFDKYNNHYFPLISKIVKVEKRSTD